LPKAKNLKRYARFDFTDPESEEVVIIGDEIGSVLHGKRSISKAWELAPGMVIALDLVKPPIDEIKTAHSIKFRGEKEGITLLRLTPKKAGRYKRLDIWIDKGGMPCR
jgi:outer membrane lipoprotein-sorting protein